MHEQAKYLELCRGEPDRVTRTPDLVRGLVHREVRNHEVVIAVAGPGQPGSAEQPAKPGDNLFKAERLGQVIVGASRNARNAVRGLRARREEQDAHLWRVDTQPAQHLHPATIREHDVQDDSVWMELVSGAHRSMPASRDRNVPSVVAEGLGQHLRHADLIVDDQDANRCTVRSGPLPGGTDGRESVRTLSVDTHHRLRVAAAAVPTLCSGYELVETTASLERFHRD